MIVRAQPQQHAYKSIFILDRAIFFLSEFSENTHFSGLYGTRCRVNITTCRGQLLGGTTHKLILNLP
jgi:hypothetical protein